MQPDLKIMTQMTGARKSHDRPPFSAYEAKEQRQTEKGLEYKL